ncbi:MAG: replication-associated recombination protein A [Planctomycetota bacterium]
MTDDLFASGEAASGWQSPLAVRMRPTTLDEFVGQEHFLGPGKLLRRIIQADRLVSLVFYGPPGTGKTTLAGIIAELTEADFLELNAAAVGVAEVKRVIQHARRNRDSRGQRTVLFLDELHRFNRTQQDVLLPVVEDGTIILIGATTQNPFFAIRGPLLSRSQIFRFEALEREHIARLIRRALEDDDRGLGLYKVSMTDEAVDFLTEASDGDARRALTALEIGVLSSDPGEDGRIRFDLELARESMQRKTLQYDPSGDEHYDAASAFIKSMRGSDPDAALYWMARMLESGEDPRFIARRIVILASEDVGNADPWGLVLANAAMQSAEFVGLPEAKIILAQAVTYLACAPKSNASYLGIAAAEDDVKNRRTVPVPMHLRDASYKGAGRMGFGKGYQYAHEGDDHFVAQDYLGVDATYYDPTDQGYEKTIARRLAEWRKKRSAGTSGDESTD